MKKFLALVLLAAAALPLAGCETVQRKFTRKPKAPTHVASQIYFDEGEYVKKYSNAYYYKTHYTLWRTWHDEVLGNLTGNDKKVSRAASESLGHLKQMQNYMKPAKSAEFQVIVNDMEEVIRKLERSTGDSQVGPLRTELERIRRAVGNDFYYDKVKGDLLSDKVDLGEGSAPAPEEGTEAKTPAKA